MTHADRPPLRWQRGSYNCIVSGEYTICKYQTREGWDYWAWQGREVLGSFANQETADAAKALCAEHARARE